MAPETATIPDSLAEGIRQGPQDAAMRQAIRSIAAQLAVAMDHTRPCSREDLERQNSFQGFLDALGFRRILS